MKIPYFFVATPRRTWLQRLAHEPWAEDSALADLSRPLLWEQPRPDRIAFDKDSWLLQFKILFLLDMWQILRAVSASESLVAEFEPGCISGAVFDRYWRCEVFNHCESTESVEGELDSGVFSRIPRTGSEQVDQWLDSLSSRAAPSV
jgi:hypothetical protein